MLSHVEFEFHTDTHMWAKATFGQCELGDARLTKRAVDIAERLASNPSASPNEVCTGDNAAAEGMYRFLRNNAVKPSALEEAPFRATAESCNGRGVVLAIQDSTTLSYSHSVSKQLGDLGGGRGYVVHSTLAVDAQTREVIGLLDQQRWIRPDKRPGKKKRNKRKYEEKESFKWERASQKISGRLDTMDNVIQVCDREADIYEFMKARYDESTLERHIVRAFHPRRVETGTGTLWEFMQEQSILDCYDVSIGQRGPGAREFNKPGRAGRSARTVRMQMRTASVELLPPFDGQESLKTNVVYVREEDPDDSQTNETSLEWMLLTSEPVSTADDARKVVEYYEQRWLIEDFHKAWKSGCNIEGSRLQTPANLERLAVLTAHIAVRLLRLRCLSQQTPDSPCDSVLDEDEWHCLFTTTNPNKPIPAFPPTLWWATQTIAKLGGWRDTKRNGRIGWMAMWKGWFRFQERLIAWKAALRHGAD